MEQQVFQRIERVFTSIFGPGVDFDPSVSREAEPRWTSFKHVEFVIALEAEFGVRFDGADATDMVSIEVVKERVEEKLS
jgi:acyl carrier protein